MLGNLRICADEHPQSPGLWLFFDTCMDGRRTVPGGGWGWAREMGGRQAGPGLGGSAVKSMHYSGS